MTPIEPIEITLDRPRKVLINHRAMFKAENEINKRREARPENYVSIDVLMVDAFNHLYRARGVLPRDLLIVMLWAGLVYGDKERPLSVDQIADLLDQSPMGVAELSGEIWAAYFKANTRNLKQLESADEEAEKKSDDMTPSDGSTNGASREFS